MADETQFTPPSVSDSTLGTTEPSQDVNQVLPPGANTTTVGGSTGTTNNGFTQLVQTNELQVLYGAQQFHVNSEGMWLGGVTFASAAFSVDMSGNVIGNSVNFTGGTIAGWTINSTSIFKTGIIISSSTPSITIGSATPNIVLNGSTATIGTSNYAAGSVGWQIDGTGNAEFNNLLARGEFHTQTLSYDSVQVTAGANLLALAGGSLLNNVTTVTSPTTFNVDINDPPSGHIQVFSANDILRIKDGSGNDNWMTVSSVSDQTSFFRYVCVLQSGTAATFYAGAAVADYGQSGQGLIYSTVSDTNAPYLSIQTQAGSPWSAVTEVVRLGNLNGVGEFVSTTYGIFIGNTSSGNYLSYDTASGDLIVNGTQLNDEPFYGDASDGNVTISSNTSLTRDMFYKNLTIDGTFTLTTNGYRVFVQQKLTINSTAVVGWNGNNGGNGNNGSGTSGGGGGTAGAALSAGSINGTVIGTTGNGGGAAGSTTGGASNGSNGSNGLGGTTVAKSIGVAGANGVAGGRGGSGGAGSEPSGGSGGTGNNSPGSQTGTVYNSPRISTSAYLLYDFSPSGAFFGSSSGSAGSGGGGGGAAYDAGGGTFADGGGGGGSGGTGSPGGIVVIFARFIVNNGTISSLGGNGGNGGAGANGSISNNGSGQYGGGGGGGGGGTGGPGGVILLVYNQLSGSGTISVAGGSGGTGGTEGTSALFGAVNEPSAPLGGTAGNTGTTGVIIQLQN